MSAAFAKTPPNLSKTSKNPKPQRPQKPPRTSLRSISKTSAEVFEVFEVFGVFQVFARFGRVFANAGKVFYVFARNCNGLGGLTCQTISFVMVWESQRAKPLQFISKTSKTCPAFAKTIPNLAKTCKN